MADEGDDTALDNTLRVFSRRAGRTHRAPTVSGDVVFTLRVAQLVKRLGWHLGKEVGLMGYDDSKWLSLIGFGLSILAQPSDAQGRAVARC